MVSPSTMTFKNLEVMLSIKLITWSPCSPVHGGLRILLNPLPRAAAPPVESCTCNGTCLPLVKTSPDGASGKEPACQCRRLKRLQFNPWVGKIPWRRDWQATPVFLPGESHGHRSLAGYCPWGHKELDMQERVTISFHFFCTCVLFSFIKKVVHHALITYFHMNLLCSCVIFLLG